MCAEHERTERPIRLDAPMSLTGVPEICGMFSKRSREKESSPEAARINVSAARSSSISNSSLLIGTSARWKTEGSVIRSKTRMLDESPPREAAVASH